MSLSGEGRKSPTIGHPELESRLDLLSKFGLSPQFPARLQNIYDAITYFSSPADANFGLRVIEPPEDQEPTILQIVYDGASVKIDLLAHTSGATHMLIRPAEQVDIEGESHYPGLLGYFTLEDMKGLARTYPNGPEMEIVPVLVGWRTDSDTGEREYYQWPAVFNIPLADLNSKEDFTETDYPIRPAQSSSKFIFGFTQPNAFLRIQLNHMLNPGNKNLVFRVREIELGDTAGNFEMIIDNMASWLEKPYPLT